MNTTRRGSTHWPGNWPKQLPTLSAAIVLAWSLSACGGGSNGSVTPAAPQSATASAAAALAQQPGAPALTNNTATDGMNWINYRRALIGLPVLLANANVATAAQGHSDYQKTNNKVSHEQVAGLPGFTGVSLENRLNAAGYVFARADRAFGEVISATSSNSGFYMAEELITAIYHRFVIFEPKFKEIGTGSAVTSAGYTYFTSNFTANNGYGPGLGRGVLAGWPANGQTQVAPNFFSDFEEPDPVANVNEVGYPISVHADLDGVLNVQTFTVRQRGGTDLSVKLLKAGADAHTPASAAAIIPLAVLKANTVYDVAFTGSVNNVAVSKNWSFTTR